jgi:hypothetical protein
MLLNIATLILFQRGIDFLNQNKIYFDMGNRSRLKPGDRLTYDEEGVLEPYCSFRSGNYLCDVGSFSYRCSPVHPSLKIGRYSSIAWNCIFNLP